MSPRIPQSATNIEIKGKQLPSNVGPDFQTFHPCWRLGNFDMEGKWGLRSLLGKFKFYYTEDLLNEVADLNLNALNDILTALDNKEFDTIDDFWSKLDGSKISLPVSVIKHISNSLFRNAFFEKIYPKLKEFETNTWDEIRQYSHGKGKSNNHNVSIKNLCKEARDRLEELGFSDRSEIYSLRLEGKIRIYGFKELNYLDIIWVDFYHEIYPTGN